MKKLLLDSSSPSIKNKSSRVRQMAGTYKSSDFDRLAKQVDGKAILIVLTLNTNCEECATTQYFISQLEEGLIYRMPKLVFIYGFSNKLLPDPSREKSVSEEEETLNSDKSEEVLKTNNEDEELPKQEMNAVVEDETPTENLPDAENEKPKILRDSRVLEWESHPYGHGYSVFCNNEVSHFLEYDHSKFKNTIIDFVRRFDSIIQTLPNLSAKRKFLEDKKTGIIIETGPTTLYSKILTVEANVRKQEKKIKVPIYFLTGFSDEISVISDGEIVWKQKGLNIEKVLRKAVKFKLKVHEKKSTT
ncbi:MAG: hypothetical protein ACI86H_000044 [bacterium]|jgi:hypothetical protein